MRRRGQLVRAYEQRTVIALSRHTLGGRRSRSLPGAGCCSEADKVMAVSNPSPVGEQQ